MRAAAGALFFISIVGIGLSQTSKPVFWSFRTPIKHEPPVGASSPIDAFIRAKLASKGLTQAPKADHRTLIRRAHFGLTGLPPKPEDLKATYTDTIERLLASQEYGERWGRHWLDVVRFGETDGGEHNEERPYAWPYRDYVIESFNADKPYNQFLREQISGDILKPHDPKMVAATGFLVAGPWDSVSAELNKDKIMLMTARMDELDDMVTTAFHTFQGLTVNCARCHDHKFDPIPARDYYKLTSVFAGVGFGTRKVATPEAEKEFESRAKPVRERLDQIRQRIADIEDPVRTAMLREKYIAFDKTREREPLRMTLNPIWNRDVFAPVTGREFRLTITAHVGQSAQIDSLKLLPNGPGLTNFNGPHKASDDKPVVIEFNSPANTTVNELIWSADTVNGRRSRMPTVYRVELRAEDGTWKPVCSSLDHVGRNELDLPSISDGDLLAKLSAAERKTREELIEQRKATEAELKAHGDLTRVYAARPRNAEKSYLLERGSVTRKTEEVTPGALKAVNQLPSEFELPADATDSQRRLALADWMASEKNPLTARVIVNRVWYYHFGNGLVNTPSDFGLMGDRPSHPELLDWLAVSFMENGWSLKWLQRLILNSETYRQSSRFDAKANSVDAGNRLLWRMPLRRMDAETLRDALLFSSGKLDLVKRGGPGFRLQEKGPRGSYIFKAIDADGPELWRRGVYRYAVRGGERIFLDSFDCPDPSVATPQRSVSNTAVQALTLLNNGFVLRQAGLFAERIEREAGADRGAGIRSAYSILFQREPSEEEMRKGIEFTRQHGFALYARVLLNSNEFVYVP